MRTCAICKQEMEPKDDCGGDCVVCLAEAGDPDCIAAMYPRIKADFEIFMYEATNGAGDIFLEKLKNEMIKKYQIEKGKSVSTSNLVDFSCRNTNGFTIKLFQVMPAKKSKTNARKLSINSGSGKYSEH